MLASVWQRIPRTTMHGLIEWLLRRNLACGNWRWMISRNFWKMMPATIQHGITACRLCYIWLQSVPAQTFPYVKWHDQESTCVYQ
jgi:hypothetical protein